MKCWITIKNLHRKSTLTSFYGFIEASLQRQNTVFPVISPHLWKGTRCFCGSVPMGRWPCQWYFRLCAQGLFQTAASFCRWEQRRVVMETVVGTWRCFPNTLKKASFDKHPTKLKVPSCPQSSNRYNKVNDLPWRMVWWGCAISAYNVL